MLDKDMDYDTDISDDDADTGIPVLTKPLVASTAVDLAQLGLTEMAYIRQALVNDVMMWTIHSAAGHPLGAAHTFEQAWAAVKTHELEPMRVH